ncbi:hypothetical protein AZE42_12381, partial [Rhizopogon vesiculosus]
MSVNKPNSSNDEQPPKNPALVVLFTILCLLSVARPTLDDHWGSKINEEEWEKHKKIVMERLNNTNITAGLVLTSSSIFISTTPPSTSILPYTIRSCYVLNLASFGHALCSLLFGLAIVNIYGAADRIRARDYHSSSDHVLCFWAVVASLLDDSRDRTILGMAATSLSLACVFKRSTGHKIRASNAIVDAPSRTLD